MRKRGPQTVGDLEIGDIVRTAIGLVVLTMRIGERVLVRSVSDDLRDASDPFEVNADLLVLQHVRGQAYYRARGAGGSEFDPVKGG